MVDHGKKFAQYRSLEQRYDLTAYFFFHSYSFWKRGSNDYFNSKPRWFFRRKKILTVTNDQLLETSELINNWTLILSQLSYCH